MIQVCSKCGNLTFMNDNFGLPLSPSTTQERFVAFKTQRKCDVYTCNGNLIPLNGVESTIRGLEFIMALRQFSQFISLEINSAEEIIKRRGLSFSIRAVYNNSAEASITNFINKFLDKDLQYFKKGVVDINIISPAKYDDCPDKFELVFDFKGYSPITNIPSAEMYTEICNIVNSSYEFSIDLFNLLNAIEEDGDTSEVIAEEQKFLDKVIRKETNEKTEEKKEAPDTTQEEEKETQEEATEKTAEEPKDSDEEDIETPKKRKPMTMVPKEKFYEAFDKGYTEEQILEEFGVSKQTYTRRKNEWLAKHSENINSAQEEPKKEKPEASASGYQWKKFKPEED